MNIKKLKNLTTKIIFAAGFGSIFLSSVVNLYANKDRIYGFFNRRIDLLMHGQHGPRGLVNNLKMSKRQIPPKKIEDLTIFEDANIKGQWSAPFDWNVTSIHSVLLPNETVLANRPEIINLNEEINRGELKIILMKILK